MKFLPIFFILALALGAGPPSPNLAQPAGQILALGSAYDAIPGLVDALVDYQIEFFEILEEQGELSELLGANEAYVSGWDARQQAMDIVIRELVEEPKAGTAPGTVDDEAWRVAALANWRAAGSPDRFHILAEVRKRADAVGGNSADGLLTGLIQSLPPDQRGAFFKLPAAEKAGALARALPARLPPEFRAAAFGIESTRKAALEKYETLRRAETELSYWFSLLAVQAKRANEFEQALEPLKLKTKGVLREITALAKRLPTPSGESRELLRLIEMPPWLSVFRGCVGNDCSTNSTFGVPNDPSDRVFFVQKPAERAPIGYVHLTEANTNKGPILYLHTIAGANLGPGELDQILYAVEKIAQSKRVGLGIPSETQIRSLNRGNDFSGVAEAKWNQGERAALRDYGHKEYSNDARQVIADFPSLRMSGLYDSPQNNRVVRLLQPLENPGVDVVFHAREWLAPSREVSQRLLWNLALRSRLGRPKPSEITEKLAEAMNIDVREIEAASELLENREGLSTAEFWERTREWVDRATGHAPRGKISAGTPLEPDVRKLIAGVWLRAHDAIAPTN
ncbi:MAG: hypothetical protein AAB425_07525, partial [Bdellovibrionota bacterium]